MADKEEREEQSVDDMIEDITSTLDLKSESPEDSEGEQKGSESQETAEEKVVESEAVAEVTEGEEEEVEERPEVVDKELEAEADEVEGIEAEAEVKVEEGDLEAQVADLKAREKALLERLETVTPPAPTPPAEPVVETPAEVKGYLEGLDIDDVVSKPEKFEEVLTEVQRRTEVATTERVLRAIPQLIITQIQQQNVLRDAVKEFYDENPELVEVKRTVGAVANEVQAENPDWSLDQVFKETAPRARKVLGLKEGAKKPVVRKRPALVKVKRGRKPTAPDLSDLEQDIADTMEI